jgi:hypothetical protein
MVEDVFVNILFLLFLGGIVVLGISLFFYYQLLKHRAFMDIANTLKFRYYYRSYAIPRRFPFLRQQRRGRGRNAFNILLGYYGKSETVVFDYKFTTGLGAEKKWHHGSFVVMHHGRNCPSLRVYPNDMLTGLGQIVGYDKIFMDDNEMGEKFSIFATDEQFALKLLVAPLIEYLLRHPDSSLEIDPLWIAMGSVHNLIPEDIPRRIRQLEKVKTLLSI